MPEGAHYFVFSRNWSGGGKRRCGECGLPYDDGDHIEITTLKPYTSYVCPTGGGLGHIMRSDEGPAGWLTSPAIGDVARVRWHADEYVTDVRPLVVLDYTATEATRIRSALHYFNRNVDALPEDHDRLTLIASAIEMAHRPKPAEPTSLGAVVRDRQGVRWVRAGNDGTPGKDPWRGVDGEHIGWWSKYNAIDAVEVLSPGVTP